MRKFYTTFEENQFFQNTLVFYRFWGVIIPDHPVNFFDNKKICEIAGETFRVGKR